MEAATDNTDRVKQNTRYLGEFEMVLKKDRRTECDSDGTVCLSCLLPRSITSKLPPDFAAPIQHCPIVDKHLYYM